VISRDIRRRGNVRKAPRLWRGALMNAGIDLVKKSVRPIIERFAPSLSRSYRWARDLRWIAKSARTSYGFWLSSPPQFLDPKWEQYERRQFERLLEFVPVCVDVGANVGIYTCIARSRDKKVLSVEPLWQNLRFLYANLLKNDYRNVEVFPLGLSNQPGLRNIYGFGAVASFVKNWSPSSDLRSATAPASTLDILLGGRFGGERMLIKIDVEGHEFEVLQGSQQVLKRSPQPIWMVEITLRNHLTGLTHEKFGETFRLFFDQGYNAYQLGAHFTELTEAAVAEFLHGGDPPSSDNFLFADPSIGKTVSRMSP
jgi:FkbM family methyltransferase